MYYLYGRATVERQFARLCGHPPETAINEPELIASYHRYLRKVSIIECDIDWDGPRVVQFQDLAGIAPGFHESKKEFYAENSEFTSRRIQDGFFERAIAQLEERDADIGELARALIKLIIINHLSKYTNGTTDDTLGVANLDFKDDFEEIDLVELVYHQLVHMMLFIDDGVSSHMDDGSKSVMIPTSLVFVLGGSDFPAYIAFHSYLVGVEVLLHREATGTLDAAPRYHGSTARILRILGQFRASLDAHSSLFLPRGQEILGQANEHLAAFQVRHPSLFAQS
jgi:hypothetical protein